MGLFDFFKKNKTAETPRPGKSLQSPAYLEGFTEQIGSSLDNPSDEWRARLRTPDGQTKFRIKFYGEVKVFEENSRLIVQSDLAPQLLYAIDDLSGQEILLFDGCKHGYDALFCEVFTDEQLKNRPAKNFYKDADGNELFEIIIWICNGIDYEEEFGDQVDRNGFIEIFNGVKIEFDTVKRNGFGAIQILAISESGKTTEILSEECA